jgi:hypothetical protein
MPRLRPSVVDMATGADPVVAEVLLHLEGELDGPWSGQVVFDGERVVEGRHLVGELDVHDRADDLDDFAFVHTKALGRWIRDKRV